MGERTPPKTRGFWISFWSISMRWKKVPQGIGHGPALAAADVAGREHWQFYRFKRLSNRALAAAGRKCRCGPLGREIRQASAPPRGTLERQRGWGYKRFDAEPFCTVVGIGQGKSKNHGFLAAFLHPFAAAGKRMSRRSAKYPCRRHKRNEQRAVGDAGPYGVRLSGCAGIRETADMDATVPLHDNRPARLRVGHGSGSGSYRRVPEPVIARHPRGAWERQRG